MATIVINDLPESIELDREAMRAIAGGARVRGGAGEVGPAVTRRPRLFDFSPGGAGKQSPVKPEEH
jgi:hypothetical protein